MGWAMQYDSTVRLRFPNIHECGPYRNRTVPYYGPVRGGRKEAKYGTAYNTAADADLYLIPQNSVQKSNNDLLALKYLVLLGYLCISTKDRDGYDATISQIRELVSSNAANAL